MMRLKLCKLNSPTDMATQTCFDQNVLKISPISNFMNNPHNLSSSPKIFYGNSYQQYASNVQPLATSRPLVIDQYTISDPIVSNPAIISEHIIFNINVRQVTKKRIIIHTFKILNTKQKRFNNIFFLVFSYLQV